MQRVQRVKVGALLEIWGRQYDKTHLVSWWAGRYSRRGLPLRGRGAYGPVLTHGPRVVAADAAGTEALVGALLEIWGRHYDKTREPPWRAGEKRHPLWWLRHHLYPKGSMSLDSQSSLTPYSTAITDSLDSQVA